MATIKSLDEATITANRDARTAAFEVLSFAPDMLKSFPKASIERFWEVLAAEAAGHIGKAIVEDGPQARTMTDDEAVAFEKELIPYGKYAGHSVGSVESRYWLAITETDFTKKLTRYLRSPYFHRNQ